jgi:hypothetical protein
MRPRCVTLHNGMIAPLVSFALRGAIWYQGENNADGNLYVEKKRAMVTDWRRWFGDERLPFYFVQLAAWQKADENPAGGGWGPIRDAQRRCLEIPHTGMASAVDIGDADDIHPRNKGDVGERLALWALANEYGQKLEPSGPLFRALKIEGGQARVLFDHVGQGLMAGTKQGRDPVREEAGVPSRGPTASGVGPRPALTGTAWSAGIPRCHRRWRCATPTRATRLGPTSTTATACPRRRFGPTPGDL